MEETNILLEWEEQYSKLTSYIKPMCDILNDNYAARFLFDANNIFDRISVDFDLILHFYMLLLSCSCASYSSEQFSMIKSLKFGDFMEYFHEEISWDQLWAEIDSIDGQHLADIMSDDIRDNGVIDRFTKFICLGNSIQNNFSNLIYMYINTLLLIYGKASDNFDSTLSMAKEYMNQLWEIVYKKMDQVGIAPGLKIKMA